MTGGPVAWMVRNPIAANLLMLFLLIGGLYAMVGVQKEVEPRYELDIVQVDVSYPGASPEEVEQGILMPVEEAVQAVQGIADLTSRAREGSAEVTLELVAGAERMRVFQEVDQAVSRIQTFPDDAQEPEVRLQARQRSVMEVGLYGQVDVWTLRQLGQRLEDQLRSHEDITQVGMRRVPGYVTHVEIPAERLRAHGLTLGGVAALIARSSQDVPAGAVEATGGEVLLRMKSRRLCAEELATIPIVTSGQTGSAVMLGDLAELRDGFEEVSFHSQFNGQPSIEVQVYRVGDESPLDVAAAVHEVMAAFEPGLPENVTMRVDSNTAEDFRERLMLLIENGVTGLLIVLVILALFLELRLALWIMTGMAVSFIGSVMLLPWLGVSINMISMFAFLVVLGIVVDDAIVVGENVFSRREAGEDPESAAIEGTREISGPVLFSVLSTVCAFLPVLLIPGMTGMYWWPLPIVVSSVLLLSLVEALLILPAHLAHVAPSNTLVERGVARVQGAVNSLLQRFVCGVYAPILSATLTYRYVTLTAALALLLLSGAYSTSAHMGMIMMPEVAADEIEAGVRLPVGTTRIQAAAVANSLTRSTLDLFETDGLGSFAEGVKTNVRRENFIDVEIVMKPPTEHDTSAAEVITLWRDEIGDLPGVNQITFEAERGPGGARDDIAIDLSHDDMEVLAHAAAALKTEAERFATTRDVSDSYRRGKGQIDLELLAEGRLMGLDANDVGRQVRNAFFGALALRQLRGTDEVEVRVELPEREREDLHTLRDFRITTDDGVEVSLLDVARIHESVAFTSLDRRAGRRVVRVSMDVEPKRAMGALLEALQRDVLPEIRADHPGLTWTFQGTQAEMRESTGSLYITFGLALLVIYALLAVSFRSYLQPLIVMAAIPFGTVGAVIGHILLGYDLSLISLMGMVALSGVVVNDSLIMVDYANRVGPGHTPREAIQQAGVRRFRPILLTTLTTFGGLTPIILERSSQANHLIPMAISLGFGIVFATAIILVIVPCLFLVLEDAEALVSRSRARS